MRFGVSVINGISANKHIMDFVLYKKKGDLYSEWVLCVGGDHVLHSILEALPTDVSRRFTTGVYGTYPCITLSPSGESTDSIVVVAYSSLVVVYSGLVCHQYIENSNVVVPTFELLCSSSGLTFTSVYLCVVWRTVWEELCVGGAVGGAVWGELCVGATACLLCSRYGTWQKQKLAYYART